MGELSKKMHVQCLAGDVFQRAKEIQNRPREKAAAPSNGIANTLKHTGPKIKKVSDTTVPKRRNGRGTNARWATKAGKTNSGL